MPIINNDVTTRTFDLNTDKPRITDSMKKLDAIKLERYDKRRRANDIEIDRLMSRLSLIKVFRGLDKVKKIVEDKENRRKKQEENIRREILGVTHGIANLGVNGFRSKILIIRN